jgi:hypothetical protein
LSSKTYARGNPKNIALATHWDGWTISDSHNCNVWSIEVNVLNAGTSNPIMLLLVLFIPMVPKIDNIAAGQELAKMVKQGTIQLLMPLILELEEIFMFGFVAYFNNLLGVEKHHIRAMLMLVMGDHPTQCKIRKLKQSGKSACRRCKMLSQLQEGRYVYGENLLQIHRAPEKRTSKELLESLNEWKKIPSLEEKNRYGRDTGIAGESPLWKLYHMYRFDLSVDLVFDIMHIRGLNMFKSYISDFFEHIHLIHCDEEVAKFCDVIGATRPHS